MGITYEEARERERQARAAVEDKRIARATARQELENARKALSIANNARQSARKLVDDLQRRLRVTRDAIMPGEATDKHAQIELKAAKNELLGCSNAREAAEERLAAAERERDEAMQQLEDAQSTLERTGTEETSSRDELDEKVQRATNAQRALDEVVATVEDARQNVREISARLEEARAKNASLPVDDEIMLQTIERRRAMVKRVERDARVASRDLADKRSRRARADHAAAEAKAGYEQAQNNLRQAIAAADRAEARMRNAQDLRGSGDEEAEREMHEAAVARYSAAEDVRTAAMTVNAQALTKLADADVEAIRLRIAVDEAVVCLDEANANRARAERELHEAEEALKTARLNREASAELVANLEKELDEAEANLSKLEVIENEAIEENEAAQEGLQDVQDMAVRFGMASRDAAGVLDQRRHRLSTAVSAVEEARGELAACRVAESSAAARVDIAYEAAEEASSALTEARAFIANAESRIQQQREAIRDADEQFERLTVAYRRAAEALTNAQREVEVANSDLTEAEVAVIMAEIDSRP